MTAQTADAPAEIDPTELELLDFEVECSTPECKASAAWYWRCLACDHWAPLCELHRRVHLDVCRWSRVIGCANCHTFALDWRLLFECIPIGGA